MNSGYAMDGNNYVVYYIRRQRAFNRLSYFTIICSYAASSFKFVNAISCI